MAALTPNELLHWLIRNQLIREAKAQLLFSPPATFSDTMTLAKELIQRDWLTPYQINQIMQGKGEDLLLGPYRLMEKLGEGAMGQVFKCWSQKLEMTVAIKMIHSEHLTSKKAMDRFCREMETAGKLDHPNIVLLRDADRIENRLFMVMDFIDGMDLARRVKQNGPLPIGQATEYCRQAALGLQHAWERGIIHRDIKPGNLLITRDANPVVKISDFGLARFESDRNPKGRLTQQGAVLGTIDYIAPEQAENAQNADVRSDIYSLGCSLYYLLTGKPPFPGTTIVEKLGARMSSDPDDPRTYRPELPTGLVSVLSKMTARVPGDRFQTPQEVATAMQPFCGNESFDAGSVPLASPVPSESSSPTKDPFSFSRSEAGIVPSNPMGPNRHPVFKHIRSWINSKNQPTILYALGGGGGIVLILAIILSLRGCGSDVPIDAYLPNAALHISLKENEKMLKIGDRKFVLFTIKRTNFSGKVEVSLENLPDGIGPNPSKITVDSKKENAEIPINVYQFAKKQTASIRVRAVAKNLQAEEWLQLKIN